MTDFCKVYKQYDTDNKCNTPCDTEQKLKDCFRHVSVKIHPDRHSDEEKEKYTEIFQAARSLYEKNMDNPLANQPRPSGQPQQFQAQAQAQQQQQDPNTLMNMFIEQFYSFISLKSGQLSQEQKFSLFICFTLMVTYTDILDDFFKGGKKNNKQKGGNMKYIVYMLALIFLAIFIIDDGDTVHQQLTASKLETIIKNNIINGPGIEEIKEASIGFWGSTISLRDSISLPQKKSAFIEFKGDDEYDDKHTNQDNLKFTIGDFIPRSKSDYGPGYLESFKNPILPLGRVSNNVFVRIFKGTIDLSQLKVVVKELVKSSDKMLGNNVISFNNEQLIVNENFFKMFSPSFIKDNKDYISENNALSCETNIENCGDFYNKMTSSKFLERRINNMITKNENNKDIKITKENIQIEINNAIDEWSFYYKQANVKDILIKMNKFENKLENSKISYDEYKENISKELYKHLERAVNIETDVILIKNDLKDQNGNINEMIKSVIYKRENAFVSGINDYVVGPLKSGLREAAYSSINLASNTIFGAINGALHGAVLDKRAVSALMILITVFGIAATGIGYSIYTIVSATSKGVVAGPLQLIEAQKSGEVKVIEAQTRLAQIQLQQLQLQQQLQQSLPQIAGPQQLPQIAGPLSGGKKTRKHKVIKKTKKGKSKKSINKKSKKSKRS